LSASRQGKTLSCELVENELFGGQAVPVLALFTSEKKNNYICRYKKNQADGDTVVKTRRLV
jgi:hypothetical protein